LSTVTTPWTGSPRLLGSHETATAVSIPEGSVRAGMTLTPYLGGGVSAQTLPRVFVQSFTHPTAGWNPLLRVSRCAGNHVPDGDYTTKWLFTMLCRQNRAAWGSPCIPGPKVRGGDY